MSTFNIQLPNITEGSLDSAKERKAILEALYQVNEQLRYVLFNIGEENLSAELKQQIEAAGDTGAIVERVDDVENGLSTFRKQTAEGFQQVARKDSIISTINQSAEMIAIAASKIALEGYVSINGSFSVDTSGAMKATGGTIGGWYIDDRYIKALTGVGAGSMLLDSATATIQGGTISGTYLTGTTIQGADVIGGYLIGGTFYTVGSVNSDGSYTLNSDYPWMSSDGVGTPDLYVSNIFPKGSQISINGTTGVTGDLGVTGYVSCTEVLTTSDKWLKKDITEITGEDAAALILSLRPVTFKYRTGNDRVHNGFIAQEAPESMRRLGPNGYFSLAYNEIIAPLVKTVQQQEKRIRALEERLAKLEVG